MRVFPLEREPVSVRDEENDRQKDGGRAFKRRADICAGSVFAKKGRTFAAYLMLEAADGKAAFRLEFPKKKK